MKKIMKLNIAICDDNKLVLENEKALIEETLKEMGIPYKMDKYQNPENLIKNAWQYDLVFLDVEMDEVNGIVAAESIHNINKECLLLFRNQPRGLYGLCYERVCIQILGKAYVERKTEIWVRVGVETVGEQQQMHRIQHRQKCCEYTDK